MIKEQIFLYQFILQIDNLMLYFEKKIINLKYVNKEQKK